MRKQGEDVDLRRRWGIKCPRHKKKKNQKEQCPWKGEAVAIPLNEKKGRLECRKLACQEEWKNAKLFWNTQCSQPQKAIRSSVP